MAGLSAGVGLALSHSLGGRRAQADQPPAQLEAADTALEAGQGEGGGVAEVGALRQVQGGEGGEGGLPCDGREVVQLEHGVTPVPADPHTVPGPQTDRGLRAEQEGGAGQTEAQLEESLPH